MGGVKRMKRMRKEREHDPEDSTWPPCRGMSKNAVEILVSRICRIFIYIVHFSTGIIVRVGIKVRETEGGMRE